MPLLSSPSLSDVAARFVLDCRGHRLDCRPGQAHVMGVLNVTPDSFSDGGRFADLDDALRRTETMIEEGAVLIDVGGESSRPRGIVYGKGAEAVEADEEKRRVLPVIQSIAERFPATIISVDTYKGEVAEAALAAGAHVVNDITGLRFGDGTARAAAEHGAPLVVMHALGRPGAMPHEHGYADVVGEVRDALAASIRRSEAAGVQDVVVDPGFGFGKTAQENLRLIAHTGAFLDLGRPVLVGISRKSTIGAVLGSAKHPVPVSERVFGTLGATAVAVLGGASIVRTHDVRATSDFLRVLAATAAERRTAEGDG